jgi:hypothetical protein
LDDLKARHVFLISDSCYSGDLLDPSRGTPEAVSNYPAAYARVSRQAMSSGASEEVDDISEFASRLKSTLMRSESAYITPDYLLSQIKEARTTRELTTIPILAVIPRSQHQLGGSFLFIRKQPSGRIDSIQVSQSTSQQGQNRAADINTGNSPNDFFGGAAYQRLDPTTFIVEFGNDFLSGYREAIIGALHDGLKASGSLLSPSTSLIATSRYKFSVIGNTEKVSLTVPIRGEFIRWEGTGLQINFMDMEENKQLDHTTVIAQDYDMGSLIRATTSGIKEKFVFFQNIRNLINR